MSGGFFSELRRRNVLRAAVLYVGAVWALAQGIASLGPSVGAPEWVTRWFLVAAAIGFPFWLAFAWFYEFTPEGLKRESEIDPADSITAHTGKKLDRWIFAVMGIAIVLLLTNTFVWRKGAGLSGVADNVPVPEKSIAVLPFVNMSSDKEQEYFSDGITEELLNLLAKIPQMQVTARTSSFSFKETKLGIAEIARQLHVAHVLEGSVRKSGDQVRITAQLINAATDAHLWSQTYDRKLDDIFAIQDEIAADVVKQLKVTLLGAAPKVRATDPEAYALYLQGVQLAQQNTAEAFEQSDALLHKALAIDPRYPPTWLGLARNLFNRTGLGLLPLKDGFAQGREAAMKALAIDPDYAAAHASVGWVAIYGDRDLAAAAGHLNHALALDPADSAALHSSASLLKFLGRMDEALALDEAVVRRDPVNVAALYHLGLQQRLTGRFDAAIASYRTVLSLSDRGGARAELGNALLLKGDAQGALVEIEHEKSEIWRMIGLPIAYFAVGRKADSDAALAALIAKYGKDAPSNIAYLYAFRGEADQAFAWLDKAIEYDDGGLTEVHTENLFEGIHADPRWLPFLRKLGQAPEQLAKVKFQVTLPDAGVRAEAATP